VYNAQLAGALAEAGHDVHLFCQDHGADELDFVDAVGEWNVGGTLAVRELGRERPAERGRCVAYRPPIGRVLPVYVADRYAHFDAVTFDRLTDEQLATYLDVNVRAVQEVAAAEHVEGALANHLVMGPAILARALPAGVPYAVKIHGSALEYTVRPHRRFAPYASEGLGSARTVLVGSRHVARRLWETVTDPSLPGRTFLGPPGVDVRAFAPRDSGQRAAGLTRLAGELERRERGGFDARAAAAVDAVYEHLASGDHATVAGELEHVRAGYDTAGIDADAALSARRLGESDGPLIVYVGKLIASKGIELLLAALPLIAQEQPRVRLAVAGFGNFREGLELLVRALDAGHLDAAQALAATGRALEGGQADGLAQLTEFLGSLVGDERSRYVRAAVGTASRAHWLGRIEHDLLPDLVAAADVQVVPSTFPEAFGMVAAEAAACGVPPVCAYHSGLAEVVDVLKAELSPTGGSLLSFDAGRDAVRGLAGSVCALLADQALRATIGGAIAGVARREFSWQGVARGVTAAVEGRHRELRVAVESIV
jgi:glycosyltransferase involved in cell wall biosynthesis